MSSPVYSIGPVNKTNQGGPTAFKHANSERGVPRNLTCITVFRRNIPHFQSFSCKLDLLGISRKLESCRSAMFMRSYYFHHITKVSPLSKFSSDYFIRKCIKKPGNRTVYNPFRPSGNYMYHLLSQSVILHFAFMCSV